MQPKVIRQGVQFSARPHPSMLDTSATTPIYIVELTPTTTRTFDLHLEKYVPAKDPKERQQQKDKVMNYYRFGMAPDFKLLVGADTLNCQMQLFEATGNVFNGLRQIVHFEPQAKKAVQQPCTLLYYDPIFSKETLRFPFSNLNTL
jgi:hypothetical protein